MPVILWGAGPASAQQVPGCTVPPRALPLIATRVEILATNLTPRIDPVSLAEVKKKLGWYLWDAAGCTRELRFLNWLPADDPKVSRTSPVLEAQFTDYKLGADVWLTFAIYSGNEVLRMPREFDVKVFDVNEVKSPGPSGARWLDTFPQKFRDALTAKEKIRGWVASSLGNSVALAKGEEFYPSDDSHLLWLPLPMADLDAAEKTRLKVAFRIGDHGAGLHVTTPPQESKVDDPKGWENKIQVTITKLEAAYPYDNYTQWSQIVPLFRRRTQGQTVVYMEEYAGRFSGTAGRTDRSPR